MSVSVDMDNEPFSDSFAKDIIILSLYLSCTKGPGPLELQAPQTTQPLLLTALSTLFNAGHPREDINVIVGDINAKSIHCIVFSENTSEELDSSVELQGPHSCSLQAIDSDLKKGADLIKDWEYDDNG